ncbi:universal stress protein [Formosa sp. S-31]|uniref:universal stress protein n=1 Tax=Formosa sp. S-31 TaxID=2790949 RepID=UPI003EBF5D93
MRHILIPTDFSENAKNAIAYALNLFKDKETTFYFLHAYQDEIYQDQDLLETATLSEITESICKTSGEKLEDILNFVNRNFENDKHSFYTLAINNMLVEAADKVVNDFDIDLIIMGTKGQSNDNRVVFGSHTLQVLKYVECPVLSIPSGYTFTPVNKILFPSDFLIPYKQRELKLVKNIAKANHANINLLYISTMNHLSVRQKNNLRDIEETLKVNTAFHISNTKNVVPTIIETIKNDNINMLVMVKTRHSFLENILFKAKIDTLSLNLDIPFLALQNTNR